MTYHFRFDRKRIIVLGTGVTLLLVMSYAAGVVTGIVLWTPSRNEIALLNASLETAQGAPPKPVAAQSAGAAPPPVAEPKSAMPPVKLPAVPEMKSTTAPARAATPAASAPVVAAVAPAPAQEQVAAMPPGMPAAPAPDSDIFSLQLGSFRDLKNAQQLLSDLKQRGYQARVFTALDGDQREWHVVRIGGFKTLTSAADAAALFTGKERLQALIRHSAGL